MTVNRTKGSNKYFSSFKKKKKEEEKTTKHHENAITSTVYNINCLISGARLRPIKIFGCMCNKITRTSVPLFFF